MSICTKKINYKLISDFHFDRDKIPLYWDELIIGNGITNWNNNGYIEMKVPNENDRVVRQTKEYYRSRGDKIIKVLFTAILNINTNSIGTTSMIGIYDDHNDKIDSGNAGFFFEYTLTDGTGNIHHPLKVGIRYGLNNIGIDSIIDQYSFNINSLNQKSGLSILDWSKLYTFEIKYNAIGYVEWSIYLDGEKLLLHRENNISKIINTLPTFNIPIRFEIYNQESGSVNSSNEMRQFNTSLYIEENILTSYQLKHFSELTKKKYTIDSFNYLPIFSFKLKDIYRRETIRIYEFLYILHKKAPFTYSIYRNINLLTDKQPYWLDYDTTSYLEYDINANIGTNLVECLYEEFVDDNYIKSKIQFPTIPLTSDIQGNTDIFTILIRKQSEKKITLNVGLRWIQ